MNSTWRRCNLIDWERRTYFISTTAIAATILAFFLLSLYSNPYYVELYINTLTVIAAGATFWAGLRVLNKQKWILYKLLKASWFYISIGLGLWLTAETIWLIYTIIFGKPLELSIADITRLFGYIFIFAGLYKNVKPFSLLFKRIGLSYKMRPAYTAPLFLGVLLIAIILSNVPKAILEKDLTTVITDISYITLDLVLLALSLEATLFFNHGKISRGLALFSTGLTLLAVSDLPYFTIGGYYPCNLLDLLYAISYIVMATGIHIYSRQTPII